MPLELITKHGADLPQTWTDEERWAWRAITAGQEADFGSKYKMEIDVRNLSAWLAGGSARRISSAFLRCILTNETWCGRIPYQGVRIRGAWFPETVDLSHAEIASQLWVEHCRVEKDWIFKNVHLTRWLSLEHSYIGGIVDISDAVLDGLVALRGVTTNSSFTMRSTRVGNQLALDHAEISGDATLDGIIVQQDLSAVWAVFRHGVNLRGAYIGGIINFDHSVFGLLEHFIGMHPLSIDMDTLIVKGNKYIRNSYIGGEMHLRGAHIHGSLEIVHAIFAQSVIMDELEVNRTLRICHNTIIKGASGCTLHMLAPILT